MKEFIYKKYFGFEKINYTRSCYFFLNTSLKLSDKYFAENISVNVRPLSVKIFLR